MVGTSIYADCKAICQDLLARGVPQDKLDASHYIEFMDSMRNVRRSDGSPILPHRVNLEYGNLANAGDLLAPVICRWMLERKDLSLDQEVGEARHLMTVGSIIGHFIYGFDATVWGSGVDLPCDAAYNLRRLESVQRLDVRAVRGPLTRQIMWQCGYSCPEIYGDPAILMPCIYQPMPSDPKDDVAVILHYRANVPLWTRDDFHYINIGTEDYETVIDGIAASRKVISSSLHGIILAESYGVPAVFLDTGGYVDAALTKYFDWYFSTGRYSVRIARSLDEALQMEPMPLPQLDGMRKALLDAFPYDLWHQGKNFPLSNLAL